MQGLYRKYEIRKSDGTEIDPNAEYFVLRLDTDSAARVAAKEYANQIRNNNPEFAADIDNFIEFIEEKIKEKELKQNAHSLRLKNFGLSNLFKKGGF